MSEQMNTPETAETTTKTAKTTSTSEQGHAKNIAGAKNLISALGKMTYTPEDEAISINSLNTLLSSAESAMTELRTLEASYKTAVNAAQSSFGKVDTHVSRVNALLKSSAASKKEINDAGQIAKSIIGSKKKDKKSTSQKSRDNVIENLKRLSGIVGAIPSYRGTGDFTPQAIHTHAESLAPIAAEVVNAEQKLKNARIKRDTALYADDGLIVRCLRVKQYIRGSFGTKSSEYALVSDVDMKKQKISVIASTPAKPADAAPAPAPAK